MTGPNETLKQELHRETQEGKDKIKQALDLLKLGRKQLRDAEKMLVIMGEKQPRKEPYKPGRPRKKREVAEL